MKFLLTALCCLLFGDAVVAQTEWKEIRSTKPKTINEVYSGSFKTVTITAQWETVETGSIGSPPQPTERHITHQQTTTYSDGRVEIKLKIIDINYYQHGGKNSIAINIGSGGTATTDAFNYRGNYIQLSPVTSSGKAVSVNNPVPYFDSVSDDGSIDRRETFFETVNEYKPHKVRFCVGLSYAPSLAYRSINTAVVQPSYSREYAQRDFAEQTAYGAAIEAKIGLSFGYRHAVMCTPIFLRQGFRSSGDSISFKDGLPYGTPENRRYEIDYLGICLSYRYSGANKRFNPVFEVGTYLAWLNSAVITNKHKESETIDLSNDVTGRVKNTFGLRAGLGFNFRPKYRWEAFFVPTIYYNITSLYRGSINTHLYNAGVSVGMVYYFIRMLPGK